MMRWLFNILAALSLLLCVATVGLWVRSYWVSDCLQWWSDAHPALSLDATRGSIDFMRAEGRPDRFWFVRLPAALAQCPRWVNDRDLKWRKLGFAYYVGPDIQSYIPYDGPPPTPIPFTEFVMPIWPLVLIFAVLPLLRCYLWFKRRRPAPGLCVKCGYDLRASKDRCPECGTPIAAGIVKEPIR